MCGAVTTDFIKVIQGSRDLERPVKVLLVIKSPAF
jgi:hypothetical protein